MRLVFIGVYTCLEKQLLEKNGRVRDLLGKLRVKILETEKEHVPDTWFTNVNTPMALSELADKRPPVFAVSGRKIQENYIDPNTGKGIVPPGAGGGSDQTRWP